MGKRHLWALGALLATLALVFLPTGPVRSQRPPRESTTIVGRIATKTGLREEDVEKVLRELGPEVQRELANGQAVELPRFGMMRVVRIPEHKDLVGGRPTTIAASNYVEFLPAKNIVDAANASGAVPAAVVPPFEYNPLPDRVPSLKTPNGRVPSTRQP